MSASEKHPVITGLVALVGVGLAVGLLLGLVTMVGTNMIGFDGEAATADATGQETLVVPEPSQTEQPSGPLITLAPGEQSSQAAQESKQPKKKNKKKQKQGISLQAGQNSVGSMDRIDLTGTYQGGDGSILQVQRRQGDAWEDFPVTAPVSDGTFSTYVQTGQSGKNRFRVRDTDSDTSSNPVTVTVN